MKHKLMVPFFVAATMAGVLISSVHAQQPQFQQIEPKLRDLPFDLNPRTPRQPTPGDAAPQGNAREPAGKQAAAPPPTTLESLFERLSQAKDAQEASAIVKQIERRWMRSGSDTTDLLMTRATQAMTAKDTDSALELFDFIIQLRPDWAEAYHKRATLLFGLEDYDGALRDLNATLAREPRHYTAMSGLGLIMYQLDNKKAAYAAYKRALEINPHFESLKTMIQRLKPEVEGQAL